MKRYAVNYSIQGVMSFAPMFKYFDTLEDLKKWVEDGEFGSISYYNVDDRGPDKDKWN